MKKVALLLTAGMLFLLFHGTTMAQTFRYSSAGDLLTMDPHSQNEGPTNAMKLNIYEGLVRLNCDISLSPGLATSWTNPNPNTYRFALRRGVKFHDGTPFTADDVLFSFKRNQHKNADLRAFLTTVKEVKKIDDFTVDYITDGPDPILLNNLAYHFIMSKNWAEKNKTTIPVLGNEDETYATRHTNGTGPFMLVERVPDTRTVVEANPNWWEKNKQFNIKRAEFVPISNDATRISALLSGQIDMVFPVPLQDVRRIDSSSNYRVLQGPELRTIFLGFNQWKDALPGMKTNPFKDIRVRKAFYQAVNIEAIRKKVMRGAATPSALMVAPQIRGHAPDLNTRYPYDPKAAKKLLTEAGYPNGFEVTLDCPNDRYVNDEAICQAVVPMLARIGVKVNLNAQTKGKHFDKIGKRQNNNTSFYMLGWTPGTADSANPFSNLMTKGGNWNSGRYENPKVEALLKKILVEIDDTKRQKYLHEAHRIHKEDFGHLPLHQQALAWGISKKVDMCQAPNNNVYLRYVNMK